MSRNQERGVDIKGIIAMALLLALCVMPNTTFADTPNAKKGIVLQGKVLKALFNGKYKELKRGDFYGYGWLDDHRVFVAFQQEGYSEAVINAEVIDLRESRVVKLGGIMEAHGDTNFDVNSHTSEIVFNAFGEGTVDPEGLNKEYVIKLISFKAQSDSYQVKTIKRNIDSRNVYWIDDNTIGATLSRPTVHHTIPDSSNQLF
jgi:hypothetical protein